jgi:hypothetical protein
MGIGSGSVVSPGIGGTGGTAPSGGRGGKGPGGANRDASSGGANTGGVSDASGVSPEASATDARGGPPAGGVNPGGGGSGDAGPDIAPSAVQVTAFVGHWEYAQGTFSIDCEGQSDVVPATGRFELEAGTDAPLWHVDETCTYRLDVAAGVASYRRDPPCIRTDMGYVLTPAGGTIRLDGSLAVVQSRFVLLMRKATAETMCTVRIDARAARIP